MFDSPYDPIAAKAPTDWITQSTSVEFEDADKRRGTHYSVYISKLEAIALAAKALAEGVYASDCADDFCDEEYLYGASRKEVTGLVFAEHSFLSDFFYGP